jgi:uncharacterized cupin superfamily protein
MGKKHSNVVNLSEIKSRIEKKGTRFGYTAKRIGPGSGAQAHGCGWFEVEPGRQAFPRHYHCSNEESIFILEGKGELRIGKEFVSVEKNDYISFPVGPHFAHSLKNTGKEPLRYLCFSTLLVADVVGYPDSKKIGVFASTNWAKGLGGAWMLKMFRDDLPVEYYEGEDIGQDVDEDKKEETKKSQKDIKLLKDSASFLLETYPEMAQRLIKMAEDRSKTTDNS